MEKFCPFRSAWKYFHTDEIDKLEKPTAEFVNQRCSDNCALYVDGKCAIVVTAEKMSRPEQ